MPTRFVKQLVLIFRGALSIGIDREAALALAMRCARDSIPPTRLSVLKDLAAYQGSYSRIAAIAGRLHKPWITIKRTLDALWMHDLVDVEEEAEDKDDAEQPQDRQSLRPGRERRSQGRRSTPLTPEPFAGKVGLGE